MATTRPSKDLLLSLKSEFQTLKTLLVHVSGSHVVSDTINKLDVIVHELTDPIVGNLENEEKNDVMFSNVDEIMSEIENDMKKEVLSDNDDDITTNQGATPATAAAAATVASQINPLIAKPFEGTSFVNDNELKSKYWIEFICQNKGYVGGQYYKCNEIDLKMMQTNEMIYGIWQDYVAIRANLFETNVKPLLKAFDTSKSIICLYDNFQFSRNEIGLLAANNDQEWFGNFGSFKDILYQLTNQFNETNDKNINSLKYYLLWNGLFTLFTAANPFDDKWFSMFESKENNTFGHVIEEYIFNEIQRTRVSRNTNEYLFDADNRLDFKKLIGYAMQDIKNPFLYHQPASGVKYFLINRLTYVIFFNLFVANTEYATVVSDKDELFLLFPKLFKLFEFLFDFSIYNALYPVRGGNENESFYILCYFYLRKFCFNKNFLTNCNYFDKFSWDGTLLHKATYNNMIYYVEILLGDGFNCLKQNKVNHTPYQVAEDNNFTSILSKFERIKTFNKNLKKNKDNNDNENKQNNDIYDLSVRSGNSESKFDFEEADDSSSLIAKEMAPRESAYLNVFVQSPGSQLLGNGGWMAADDSKNSKLSLLNGKIESCYFTFENQIAFCRYLLYILGCYDNEYIKEIENEQAKIGLKHTEIKDDSGFTNEFTDGLFYDFSQFRQFSTQISMLDSKKVDQFMVEMVRSVIRLIENKTPLSDDILILCFEYCLLMQQKAFKHGKTASLMNELVKVLKSCVKEYFETIDSKQAISDKNNSAMKLYHHLWFNEYLLHSNIWLCKDKGRLLYDTVAKAKKTIKTTNELIQKEIWENVKIEEAKGNESKEKNGVNFWQALLRAPEYLSDEMGESLRQDKLDNGIKSDVTEAKLYSLLPIIDTNNFDIFQEYNNKVFLTKCLVFAHEMNPIFIKDMKSIFGKFKCSFSEAPVKTYERSAIKCSVEYADAKFPSGARIVDFNRASVTFDSCQDMLQAMQDFEDKIDNKEAGCVIEIMRVKNGFKHILDWKSSKDCTYCDIKLNVLIYNENSHQSMIGEVQFLLVWLSHVKTYGRGLYEILRKDDFIHSVNNLMEREKNYGQYKSTIMSLIETDNHSILGKHLFWKPNIILSMLSVSDNQHGLIYPLLCHIGNKASSRVFELFLGCMLHFAYNFLGFDAQNANMQLGKEFLTKYFNFNQCKHIIERSMFWGIQTSKLKKPSTMHKCIEIIMQSPFFYGVSQLIQRNREEVIGSCVAADSFEYLKLIVKYYDKNAGVITNGLNFYENDNNPPLIALLNARHCNTDWLNLLLFEIWNCVSSKSRTKIALNTLQEAMLTCQNNDWKQMIERYANVTDRASELQV